MRLSIQPNNSSRSRRRVVETFQDIPDKGQLQFLFFADAVGPHAERGFVAVFPKRRGPLNPAQERTICDKPVYLEMHID